MIKGRFRWQRPVLFILLAVAALAVVIFALRTYRSFLLLHSAYELGAPDAGSVRPWMTLEYVARSYHVPETALAERLGHPSDIDPKTTLRSLARREGLSPFEHIRKVQEAISGLRPITLPPDVSDVASEADGFGDDLLGTLLVYGYPVLGLMLVLGAIGVPFPSALSVVVAGSLAAQGEMSWFWAGAVVVASSVLGDLASYGLGTVLGREFF